MLNTPSTLDYKQNCNLKNKRLWKTNNTSNNIWRSTRQWSLYECLKDQRKNSKLYYLFLNEFFYGILTRNFSKISMLKLSLKIYVWNLMSFEDEKVYLFFLQKEGRKSVKLLFINCNNRMNYTKIWPVLFTHRL